jgi:hypothetical protein
VRLRAGDEVTLSTRSTGQIKMVMSSVEVDAVAGIVVGKDNTTPVLALFEEILLVERREADGQERLC